MDIKKIQTKDALPGMLVAEDIYGFQNNLLIPKEARLSHYSITRLKFYSINEISVFYGEDISEDDIAYMDEILTDTYSEYIKNTPEFINFKTAFTATTNTLQYSISKFIKTKQPLDTDQLYEQTVNILAEGRNGTHVFHMLHCMRDNFDVTFAHSMNVALICNVCAKWLRFSEEDTKVLTLAGLLHDIGKIMIPPKIISKPSSLSKGELGVIQNHPTDGYRLLSKLDVDERIKYAAIMHHEYCDGTGYPDGLNGKQIDEFAKIVAIADIYDAMTSARVYRAPLSPFDVIHIFETEGFQKYEPHYLLTFLEGIANTYIGSTVRLNDGRVGEIIMIDNNHLSRPVLKVGASFVDLAKVKGLRIAFII